MVWGAEGYQEPLLGPPELFTPIACSGGQKGVLGGAGRPQASTTAPSAPRAAYASPLCYLLSPGGTAAAEEAEWGHPALARPEQGSRYSPT